MDGNSMRLEKLKLIPVYLLLTQNECLLVTKSNDAV
jgi:hypothetical protein